jgi:hypothetical protein
MASQAPKRSNKICSTPNCGKPLVGRGFCCACYYRKLRHGEFVPKSQTYKWKHRLTEVDTVNRTANCASCGKVKIRSRGNNQWRCATHQNEKCKLYKRAYRQAKKDMLKDSCEICGKKDKLCWDHCHKNGNFRGTLCNSCNSGIGFFKDDVQLLKKAIKYLKNVT